MKRLIVRIVMVRTAFILFLLSTNSHAQSGALIQQADAGHASQASCVIVKRMGRIDRAKSRLPSLGITGKQFRYVEGKLPEGFSPHHKMTDHDVRNLQARGAQVLVLDSHYSPEDLTEARANCPGPTGKTLTQAEAKAPPAPAPAPATSTPTPAPKLFTGNAPAPKAGGSAPSTGTTEPAASSPASAKVPAPKADDSASTRTIQPAASSPATAPNPPKGKAPTPKAGDSASSKGATEAALVDISSTPAGADVYIDERFFGRTPATTIILMPGSYKIAVKKDGFVVWTKKFNLPSGRSNIDAALILKAK